MTLRNSLAALTLATATALSLSACNEDWTSTTPNQDNGSSSQGQAGDTGVAGVVDQDNDYYRVVGTAVRDYQTTPGNTGYCEPDELARARCAFGELTADTREAAKDRGRQDITVDPAGWTSNSKVSIPALAGVAGSTDYNGWMYNRSHLLADSLGGTPTTNNLVTGTRTQNVGSADNGGGMAYTETIARDYLDSAVADTCPLYYAATPNYERDELLPRTVTVDIQSCDQTIDQRVIVDNTANGHALNYATGDYVDTSSH